MKKLLLSLLLLITIFSNQAKAGVLLMASGSQDSNEWSAGTKQLSGIVLITTALAVGLSISKRNLGAGIIIFGVALDAAGNLKEDQLVNLLSEKYPFIDNQSVIKGLVGALNKQFHRTQQNYVELNEKEILNLLSPMELTHAQVSEVLYDLGA